MKLTLLKIFSVTVLLLLCKVISAQTFNADFYYTTYCRTVTFFDSSSGANNQHFWDFGDGGSDYAEDPQHTYSINGNYTVTLVIICMDSSSSNFLNRDTMAKQVTINCNACNIYAEFSAVRDQVNYKKILFTNQSTGQTTYNSIWDFGYTGNGGSTLQSPDHTFPSSGSYFIKLKAWYYDSALSQNCLDSVVKEIRINELRANFSYSIDPVNCTTVTFTDSSSGSPTYYSWEFGDNGSSGSTNPVHTYSIGTGIDTQVFNVRLMIYDFDSTTGYFADTIVKQVVLPPCNICQINASIYLQGDSITAYSGTLYNYSTGTINKHYWDFGDGGTSTSNAPVHNYANPGQYTIMYIAMDTIKNCRDTAWLTFTIDSLGFIKRQAFVLTVIDKTTTGILKVNTIDKNNLKAYPNPANNYFILEGARQRIVVYNLMGSKVGEYQLNTGEQLNINTSGWARGLYIVTGENRERLKLMIE